VSGGGDSSQDVSSRFKSPLLQQLMSNKSRGLQSSSPRSGSPQRTADNDTQHLDSQQRAMEKAGSCGDLLSDAVPVNNKLSSSLVGDESSVIAHLANGSTPHSSKTSLTGGTIDNETGEDGMNVNSQHKPSQSADNRNGSHAFNGHNRSVHMSIDWKLNKVHTVCDK
jgi:hypothetical protein